jgi:hypothetical protein
MGPRASLDAVAKRKIPYSYQESNPSHPARNLFTMLTELPRLTSLLWSCKISFLHLVPSPLVVVCSLFNGAFSTTFVI